ncbi:MFS transporter [Pseudogracilibacillus auburnensis]|uniref:ACDE family multidrug resistance protein n=1 Tax=Pseudogracilibacillus auburnensis TaxID=1494959 RepID=A0A2V3WDW8_9BACI|nr:MFS transporter [Pseudogracilibacillus auburnensis]PXW86999.1 ACDE family multidrug resistance protein [Pseudogracilibacillus auburnensis]
MVNQNDEKRWAIISLASVPLIMTLGNSMLIPILPLMEKKLDISKLQSSYIITVYSVVAIIFIPLAGYLSDRFGRKKVMIPALIITGIGGLIAGLASWKMDQPYTVILIGRVLQGIGASGAMPIVFPLVGDMFRRDSEASATLGIIETSNTVGKVLSPILGSALTAIIWFLPFFSIPVFCAASVLMIIFLIKNKKKNEEEEPLRFKQYWQLIKDVFRDHKRWLIAIFIIGAILMFILFGFLFYLSNILEDKFDIDGIKKGLLLAIPLLALSIASYVTGKKIKDNLTLMKWITFIGIVFAGCSVAVISFMDHFIYLLIIFLICGAGIGMALPCLDSLITKSLDKTVRGAITSIYSSMRFIGVAAGPPAVAVLMKQNIIWMVCILTFFALGAGFLAFKNINPE